MSIPISSSMLPAVEASGGQGVRGAGVGWAGLGWAGRSSLVSHWLSRPELESCGRKAELSVVTQLPGLSQLGAYSGLMLGCFQSVRSSRRGHSEEW